MDIFKVDLGFGFTKAGCGPLLFKQPSVIGTSRVLLEEEKQSDGIICGDYFVGELALERSDFLRYSMAQNKAEEEVTDILLRAAYGTVSRNKDVFFVTGLPFSMFEQQKEQMINLIKRFANSNPYTIEVIGEGAFKVHPKINGYKIFMQGYAAVMDYYLDDKGNVQNELSGRNLCLDVGFYTLDAILLNGIKFANGSKSYTNLGASEAVKMVKRYIEDKLSLFPTLHELDMAMMTGVYMNFDISQIVQKAHRELANQILSVVKNYGPIKHLFLTGGAAEFLYPFFPENTIILANPQFSNLNGYEKIARRMFKN